MAVSSVLDRKFVQSKLSLHRFEFFRGRLIKRDPDKTLRTAHILVDLPRLNISELPPFLVSNAVDEHRVLLAGIVAPHKDGMRQCRVPRRPDGVAAAVPCAGF